MFGGLRACRWTAAIEQILTMGWTICLIPAKELCPYQRPISPGRVGFRQRNISGNIGEFSGKTRRDVTEKHKVRRRRSGLTAACDWR